MACGILVPPPGTECGPTAVKELIPNHWTAREFPRIWWSKRALERLKQPWQGNGLATPTCVCPAGSFLWLTLSLPTSKTQSRFYIDSVITLSLSSNSSSDSFSTTPCPPPTWRQDFIFAPLLLPLKSVLSSVRECVPFLLAPSQSWGNVLPPVFCVAGTCWLNESGRRLAKLSREMIATTITPQGKKWHLRNLPVTHPLLNKKCLK